MRYRYLLNAFLLSVIIMAADKQVLGQTDTVVPQNNLEMNHYTYIPQTYQRGASTSQIRMFPNPARSQATVYVNSIHQQDRGELVLFNNRGKAILRNVLQPGNNNLNVASFPRGMYTVKIYEKDRSIFTRRLMVSN